jgi:ribosomal protein S18 acetylase RimI-like enzyme
MRGQQAERLMVMSAAHPRRNAVRGVRVAPDARCRTRPGLDLSDRVIRDVRSVLEIEGVDGLWVDDLIKDDLSSLGWSGAPLHLVSVGRALDRVASGEVEYLVVRAPDGHPIAKVGIDYAANPGAGTLWQMATAHELQGLGIGTHLISVAESRIRERGLLVAQLDVGDNNPRARALYERLGYREAGRRCASWDVEDADGNVSRYETELVMLRKELSYRKALRLQGLCK